MQKRQVRRWIAGKDARQYGFELGLWRRRHVRALVEESFGVRLGLTCLGKMLAELGVTPRKPQRRTCGRDGAGVEKWRREDYPRLRRRAKRGNADMFFGEEAGFSSEPNLGRT